MATKKAIAIIERARNRGGGHSIVSSRRGSARSRVALAGLVLLAAAFSALGTWQLRRAGESRTLAARFTATAAEPPLERAPTTWSDDVRFRRLGVRGSYGGDRQFLLDNRVRDGVAGYEVLTPFEIARERRWLLVNRGWIPADPDRNVLPDVAVDGALRGLAGRIERLPRPGMRLGTPDAASAEAPLAIVLYPTAAELAARLGVPLPDYQVLLDEREPDGFVRDWHAPGLAPQRHLAYAGQWFLLALGSVGAAVAIAIKARSRTEART
jgi:surfeit locus 1 family protein